jgi:hypothetical protein
LAEVEVIAARLVTSGVEAEAVSFQQAGTGAIGQDALAKMREARKSVETFYATLSDAQKTVFDAEFQQMGRKGERGMKGGGPRDGSGMGPGRG